LRDSSHLMRLRPPNWPVAGMGGKIQRGIMKRCPRSGIRCASAPGSVPGVICVAYLVLERVHDAGR
jgi:hypothetical protein